MRRPSQNAVNELHLARQPSARLLRPVVSSAAGSVPPNTQELVSHKS
jgi:hypothetical protein